MLYDAIMIGSIAKLAAQVASKRLSMLDPKTAWKAVDDLLDEAHKLSKAGDHIGAAKLQKLARL